MWKVSLQVKAEKDFAALDTTQQAEVVKKLTRVAQNPLPQREGGYGVELGNKHGINLTGCLKIKLKKSGIRIVYTLERTEQGMTMVIIGMRSDDEVYREAARRLKRA